MTTSRTSDFGWLGILCAVLSLSACSGESETQALPGIPPGGAGAGGADGGPAPETGGFISDDPNASSSTSGTAGPSAGAGGATGAAGSSATAPTGSGDAARAIQEADIIQLAGNRLYALSRYGGLSIIDVGTRDQLRIIGRFRMSATPFEMYLRGNVVLAMFSDWAQYVDNADGTWQYVQTSRVVALDTTDPANIQKKGDFEIPGAISDSRAVGDIVYVVAHEDGYCWHCSAADPRTTIVSLNVADPASIGKVDQLAFGDTNDQWGWSGKSVTVTEKRMYVAGREYSDTLHGSTIQVVDIADPTGDMKLGASVEADGEIRSRWQMDEYQGVLRVLSQTPQWDLSAPPVVQTFTIVDTNTFVALGQTTLTLPRPEQLQTVRLDGPRGYAITFERTDPLFTIDLSNPAQPRQVGTLEMPGWVYHLEPRGNRVIGLGYDQNNSAGAITVSVFDVTDLTKPTMLDRVNFGGDWGYLPEDQDRIHKAFQILDTAGLVLVPFSGSTNTSSSSGCYAYSYRSGVQLIDLAGDDLTLRGMVPSYGQARRAFLHDERLFTVSDDRVQTFDVSNRDAPAAKASVALSHNVSRTAAAGNTVVRLGQDWWSNTAALDITTLAKADVPVTNTFDVSLDPSACGSAWPREVLAMDGYALVLADQHDYTAGTTGLSVVAVDISDPNTPKVVGRGTLPGSQYGYYYDSSGVIQSGAQVVRAGSALVRMRSEGEWVTRGIHSDWVEKNAKLDVVDLRDPAALGTTALDLRTGYGVPGLHVDGDRVMAGHYEPLNDGTDRGRFFIDRFDVSNPASPKLEWSVNVPGSLFAWDGTSRRAVTVDYRHIVREGVTGQTCYQEFLWGGVFEPSVQSEWGWDPTTTGTCTAIEYMLRLVRIDGDTAVLEGTYDFARGQIPGMQALGTDRAFVSVGGYYGYASNGCIGGCGSASDATNAQLLVLSGLRTGTFEVSPLNIPSASWGNSISLLTAFDTRALVSTGWQGVLSLVDASGATPTVARTIDVVGYPNHVTQSGSKAILSLGMDGVTVVDLAQ